MFCVVEKLGTFWWLNKQYRNFKLEIFILIRELDQSWGSLGRPKFSKSPDRTHFIQNMNERQ